MVSIMQPFANTGHVIALMISSQENILRYNSPLRLVITFPVILLSLAVVISAVIIVHKKLLPFQWKLFLPLWLVLFLLAPEIWIYTLFTVNSLPPGSPQIPEPIFIPFGAIHFGRQLLDELAHGWYDNLLGTYFLMIFRSCYIH